MFTAPELLPHSDQVIKDFLLDYLSMSFACNCANLDVELLEWRLADVSVKTFHGVIRRAAEA